MIQWVSIRPYGQNEKVTTKGYNELCDCVLEIKANPEKHRNPFPKNSPLMDPYRDGKAIQRFQKLLN